MKFLIVIFYLVDGQPKGGDLLGIAVDRASCEDFAVQFLTQRTDAVKQMIEQGVRPQIHCLPAPQFSAESRQLVAK